MMRKGGVIWLILFRYRFVTMITKIVILLTSFNRWNNMGSDQL